MNQSLVNFLESILGNGRVVSHDEMIYYCPFCKHHKQKMAVNIETYKWHCWTCSEKGNNIISLLNKLNITQEKKNEFYNIVNNKHVNLEDFNKINKKTIKNVTLDIPKFTSLLKRTNSRDWKNAINYIKKRKININDIIKYNISYCDNGRYYERIIIPSYDSSNNINYFIARSYNEDNKLKYLNPKFEKDIIFNENQISWKFPITICEGVFDMIGIRRNAIPLLGKTIQSKLLEAIIINKPPRINIALDKDATSNAIEIIEKILNLDIPVHFVELTDKDPSEIGFINMCQLIDNARRITFKDIVNYKM